MIYIFIFFIIAFFSILELYSNSRIINQLLSIVLLFLVVLFQSLRWRTGTDWISYSEYFINNSSYSDFFKNTQFEIGYSYLNYLIKFIFDNYNIFLFIFCSLIAVFVYRFLNAYKFKYTVLFVLFYFSFTLFPIRQTLAIYLVFCSYKYVYNKNFWNFFMLVFFASLFHRSALFFFPFYFILNVNFKLWHLIFLYVLSIFVGLTNFSVTLILKIIPLFVGNIDPVIESKLYTLLTDPAFAENATLVSILTSFFNSVLWILFFIVMKQKIDDTKLYMFYFKVYMFSLIISRLFLLSFPELARLNGYFSGAFMFLIIYLINQMEYRYRLLLVVFVVMFCFSKYWANIMKYPDLYLPYISIFEKTYRVVY